MGNLKEKTMVKITQTSRARNARRSTRSRKAQPQALDRAFIEAFQPKGPVVGDHDGDVQIGGITVGDVVLHSDGLGTIQGLGTIPALGDLNAHVLMLPINETELLSSLDLIASHDHLEDVPLPALDVQEFAAAFTGLDVPEFEKMFCLSCPRLNQDGSALLRTSSVYAMSGVGEVDAFKFEPHSYPGDMAGVYRTLARGADEEMAALLASCR
jgi:hypothetical protein